MGRLAPLKKGIVERKGIFVVGAARSGTTLLRLLINNHPDIACIGETQFFHHNYLQLSNNQAYNLQLLDHIFKTESEVPDLLNDLQLEKDLSNIKTVAGYFDFLLSTYSNKLGKKYWAEKSPSHVIRLNAISKMFPDIKVVNIIRNPYFSAISRFKKLKNSQISNFSLITYIKYIKRVEDELVSFQSMNNNALLTIRYEDLSSVPLGVITKVFKFLEVDSSVVNSEFLKISKKNIPVSSDGEEQEHHSRVGEKLNESIYDIDEYFSAFQLYLFSTELSNSIIFKDYIENHKESNFIFFLRKALLDCLYTFIGIPKYRLRRLVNQIKSSLKRILS